MSPADVPIYDKLLDRYGEEFCRRAGYFDETKPPGVAYSELFNLPSKGYVVQASGAFHPFHEGHLESIFNAVAHARTHTPQAVIDVVIHVDHAEYRSSKGHCSLRRFMEGLKLLDGVGHDTRTHVVMEDNMPNGCSRNFTRLYDELRQRDNQVWFVCGGDRANYALAFRDEGHCIVSGRDSHPMYDKYHYLSLIDYGPIRFIPGDHPASSTAERGAA